MFKIFTGALLKPCIGHIGFWFGSTALFCSSSRAENSCLKTLTFSPSPVGGPRGEIDSLPVVGLGGAVWPGRWRGRGGGGWGGWRWWGRSVVVSSQLWCVGGSGSVWLQLLDHSHIYLCLTRREGGRGKGGHKYIFWSPIILY